MSTTVEDIEYLKKYGSKESHLFLVDSSKRDTSAWPTPAEYSIDFQTPFRQVYGVDIIDASIPRTQYNIETFNNEFSYTLMGYDGANNVSNTFVVEPADYEFNDFVTEFGEKAPSTLLGGTNRLTVAGLYKMDGRTGTRSIKNKLEIRSAHAFRLDECSLGPTMGFYFENLKTDYVAKLSTSTSTSVMDLAVSNVAVASTTFTSANVSFRQPFTPDIVSGVKTVGLDCKSDVSGAGLTCTAVITDADGTEFSNVKTVKVPNVRTRVLFEFDFKKTFVMQRTAGVNTKRYYVKFAVTTPGETLTVYGFNNTHYAEVYPYNPPTVIPNFTINMDMTLYAWRLEAPYLYEFTGDTYLQIRCKEIEQYLFRTRAYETYNAGLAKIPLGIFGFTNQDFDYTSFPPREFHPIGKLSTMTFRFERFNGQLYDFKGINHTFTMVIRYYAIRDRPFDSRILNPTYDPDILKYMNEHKYIKKDDDIK
jgi:hypothetical protein